MCLGVPMKVQTIKQFSATCEYRGITRNVNLFLLQDQVVEEGDFVLVHVGYAIQKVATEEAEKRLKLYQSMEEGDS